MEKQQFYSTRNLNIAAFLYAAGVKFEGSSSKQGVVIFRFFPREQAQKLVDSYFQDKTLVNPRELFAKLKDLKDLIFDTGRDN